MSKKFISILLIIALLVSSILSCYAETEDASLRYAAISEIEDKGLMVATKLEETVNKDTSSDEKGKSEQWEDYIGDIETFVYGLIINKLQYLYDAFPASIDLPDGNVVYGIAYSDYQKCYTNEDESKYCFEAGFVPFPGELGISDEDFNSGLYISDLDFTEGHDSFIWVYGSTQIKEHCVVYGKYLTYGIDEKGSIFYETTDYVPSVCDENLGSLYSYDEGKYLFDIEIGNYLRITGNSLYSRLDYKKLEEEINRILIEQDANFATIDTVKCAYFAQEAIVSYLLSLQEETFLGYNVQELIEAANTLDPMECYRITADGIVTLKLEEGTKASDLTKWLVGTTCVIVSAVAVVGSIVFIECPALSALSGAVAGAAIEIFMQVVISEKDLDSVNWSKVAIGAAAGALSGFLGPYIHVMTGGSQFAYIALDSALDGLIGGIERATEAWIDGSDAVGIIKSLGFGFASGFALSAGFKGASALVSKIAGKLSPAIKKLAEKLPEKLTNKVSSIKQSIGKTFKKLKETADSSIFHSEYITKKMGNKQIGRLRKKDDDRLMKKSIDNLSVDNMFDINGEKMTKNTLRDIAADAEDGAILGFYKHGDDVVEIVKKNSMVSLDFDPSKYQTVNVPGGLISDRSKNFTNVAKELKDQWLEDPSLIPESIANAIRNKGTELEELMPNDLVSIIQKSDWVIHENMDKMTAILVPRGIHQDIKHMGGVGLAKYLKSHMGMEYFDRLVSAAASETIIAVN